MRVLLLLAACITGLIACTSLLEPDFDGQAPSPTPTPTPPDLTVSGFQDDLNECTTLVKTTGAAVVVATPPGAGFATGTHVLLWQVSDSVGTVTHDVESAAIAEPGDAGLYEIATISSTAPAGTTLRLTLEAAPAGTYGSPNARRRAQACTVPVFRSVVIASGGALAGTKWTGSTGGVIAMIVTSHLEIAAGGRIDASRIGFRGGDPSEKQTTFMDATAKDVNCVDGAHKGEGIFGVFVNSDGTGNDCGRGAFGTGGGGGNANRAGGGGGGNGGSGGIGALSATGMGVGGVGGARVSSARALLGGGGGGGHQVNVANEAGAGGAGGGFILLLGGASVSVGGGGNIVANGAKGGCSPSSNCSVVQPDTHGAGGGGAGGTIISNLDAAAFTGFVRANGGDGGDVYDDNGCGNGTDVDLKGGGGGGGGMIIWNTNAPVMEADYGLGRGCGNPPDYRISGNGSSGLTD